MAKSMYLKLEGAEETIAALMSLPKGARNRVLGPALKAAGAPIWKSARKKLKKGAGKESGLYAKSIGAVLRKKRGRNPVLVVGPRIDGKFARDDVPSNLGALLEYGHGGPAPAPPIPHLRPAVDENAGEAVAAFNARAKRGLEAEARRAAKKALSKIGK